MALTQQQACNRLKTRLLTAMAFPKAMEKTISRLIYYIEVVLPEFKKNNRQT
jgi:hypothetical protein